MKQFYPTLPHFIHEIEIKKSRFITHVAHTPTPADARIFIEKIEAEHPKANHNCTAQIAGSRADLKVWNSDDDGEPKGTAGKPMLNVLEHSELCEICVVVTRYFGGIKLGAGGLVRAYSQAVQEALTDLPVTERIEQYSFSLTTPHHLVGELEHKLARAGVRIDHRDWGERLIILGGGSETQLKLLHSSLTNVQHLISYEDPFTRKSDK